MLFLDLKVFHRKSERISVKNALIWSAIWIALAVVFGIGIFLIMGHDSGLQFFTGYILEKSLSIDNLFVFLTIFTFFSVKDEYQHRVLFWGVLGAIVLRVLFILVGIELLKTLSWVMYIFGAFLVFTGLRMVFKKEEKVDVEHNPILRIVRRVLPVSKDYHEDKFVIVENGVRKITPLLMVLLMIEGTDVVFALDSVPAVLSVTTDSFIVFSSNIMAILGLRSLYFAIVGVLQKLRFLQYGLAVVLVFLGIKMIIGDFIHMPVWVSLAVICSILTMAIVSSLMWSKRHPKFPDKGETGQE